MSRFKKGEWKEARTILLYDLNKLEDYQENKEDFNKAFSILHGNLLDLYGVKEKIMDSLEYSEWETRQDMTTLEESTSDELIDFFLDDHDEQIIEEILDKEGK